MKPRKEDQQLRSVSLSDAVALQALRRKGLDASTDSGSNGEEWRSVFA
jgi:hypothetical protein